jgi:hypothetical protein
VYLGLIFLALGFVPRSTGSTASYLSQFRLRDLAMIVCVAISLSFGVGLLGQFSPRCRSVCYLVLSISNACFCFLAREPEIGLGLLFVAGIAARPLVPDWIGTKKRSSREWWTGLIRFNDRQDQDVKAGESLLFVAFSGFLAFVVIGTLAYSLRIETSRTISSPRFSALPSQEFLERIHFGSKAVIKQTALVDLLTGQRADIVVLLAAIVFLRLAISLNESKPSATSQVDFRDPPD